MTETAFLILHGWDNFRPAGHWQHELAVALRGRGRRVDYPQLPDAAQPSVEAWRDALAQALEAAAADGRRVVVLAHSLACLLWLGARPRTADEAVERVLLVAPPAPAVVAGIPEIAAFAALELSASGAPTTIAASDDDPYCPEGAATAFGEPLGIPVTVIAGGGHLERTAGYGEWPSVLAWSLDAAAPLLPNTAR
ncbi:RBBP9/YdeN family alpha/beta hydrolase [Leifsonia sp. NPDC058292]|uniref:RBBP9/YdeN family alpha/beta hydrolase n=1 Tax=Leifsonia sp. NPDC058292 TaxID=3346428 RepID=UPI0036D98665